VQPPVSRRSLAPALGIYAAGLAVVLLAPSSELPSRCAAWAARLTARLGAPDWMVEPSRFEFLANALILMPVSALGILLWPRTSWRDWTAYAFVIAGGVELAQGLFLPDRSATFVDVVANTLGGLGGAAFVTIVVQILGRPSAT
jgi:hypothetical protein